VRRSQHPAVERLGLSAVGWNAALGVGRPLAGVVPQRRPSVHEPTRPLVDQTAVSVSSCSVTWEGPSFAHMCRSFAWRSSEGGASCFTTLGHGGRWLQWGWVSQWQEDAAAARGAETQLFQRETALAW
jgi:hypothetical protein